jgi:hypothetical protein
VCLGSAVAMVREAVRIRGRPCNWSAASQAGEEAHGVQPQQDGDGGHGPGVREGRLAPQQCRSDPQWQCRACWDGHRRVRGRHALARSGG